MPLNYFKFEILRVTVKIMVDFKINRKKQSFQKWFVLFGYLFIKSRLLQKL